MTASSISKKSMRTPLPAYAASAPAPRPTTPTSRKPPVRSEREDDIADRAGGMVVGGGQDVDLAAKRLHAMRRRAVRQHVPVAVLNGRDFVHAEKRAFAVEHLAAGSDDAPAHEQARGRPGEEQRRPGREQQQARRDRERRPNHALRDLRVAGERLQPGEERGRRERSAFALSLKADTHQYPATNSIAAPARHAQRPAGDFAMRSAWTL